MGHHIEHPNVEISVRINDEFVTARTVFLTIAEFSLKLIQPAFDFSIGSRHIPYFSLSYHKYYNPETGKMTEYGLQAANEMIIKLYNLRKEAILYELQISDSVVEIQKYLKVEEKKVKDETEKLYAERREIRRRFKAGELSQRDYQSNLKKISSANFDMKINLSDKVDNAIKEKLNEFYKKDNCLMKRYIKHLIHEKN